MAPHPTPDARLRDHLTALLGTAEPEPCLDHAAAALGRVGFVLERRAELGALLATRGAGGVVLSGHVDVVPAGDGWTTPPHTATFRGDRVVARGAADMRGAVAAMLRAVERSRAPAKVVLTSDEETTMHAARVLAAEGVVAGAPLVVVGEPTGLQLGVAGKGVAWIRATVSGRSAHAATPHAGESAAEKLAAALPKVPLGPCGPAHALLGRATIALTGLASGDRYNVLPSAAEARFDARFPPPWGPEDAVRLVRDALPQAAITLAKQEPAFEAREDSAATALRGLPRVVPPPRVGVPYASEAGHWGPLAPTVILGPGRIEDAHGPDESVALADVEKAVRMYVLMVENLAGPP